MARDSSAISDASIDTAASGDTTIVAAVAGKKIVVHSYAIVADAAVSARWKSGSTNKSGAMSFGANGGISAPGGIEHRWFSTGVGEALILNLSTGVQVSGHVAYSTS